MGSISATEYPHSCLTILVLRSRVLRSWIASGSLLRSHHLGQNKGEVGSLANLRLVFASIRNLIVNFPMYKKNASNCIFRIAVSKSLWFFLCSHYIYFYLYDHNYFIPWLHICISKYVLSIVMLTVIFNYWLFCFILQVHRVFIYHDSVCFLMWFSNTLESLWVYGVRSFPFLIEINLIWQLFMIQCLLTSTPFFCCGLSSAHPASQSLVWFLIFFRAMDWGICSPITVK